MKFKKRIFRGQKINVLEIIRALKYLFLNEESKLGTKTLKSMSFHQYLINVLVETTWISLIG